MEENTAVEKSSGVELANFGGRDPIKEMALRLKTMMPNAQKFTDNEAQAVAQVAFAHNLDPFNGEVWGIKSDTTWYGVMVGIKGIRKGAKREADKTKSVYWLEVPRLVDAKKYGIDKPGAIAYEIVLRDTLTVQAWTKTVGELVRAGAAYKEAVEMMGGQMPCTIGVGIADPSERSKMSLHARAKKRAEADALKIRYSLEFGGAKIMLDEEPESDEAAPVEFVDGEYIPALEAPRHTEAENLSALGFDVDEPKPAAQPAPVATEPEPQAEEVDEADAANEKIEYRELHAQLWKQASTKKLITPETAKEWAVKSTMTTEEVAMKCQMIEMALQ